MMQIRHEQVNALKTQYTDGINQRIRDQLLIEHPSHVLAKTPRELLDQVCLWSSKAEGYGFRSVDHIFDFSRLGMLFGLEFDKDVEHPWIAKILGDKKLDASTKMEWMLMTSRFIRSDQEPVIASTTV